MHILQLLINPDVLLNKLLSKHIDSIVIAVTQAEKFLISLRKSNQK